MLRNFRLIAIVFVFAASGFGAIAQTTETNNFKDVLLDGKPAKLNLVTGEITFTNGEIAKTRTARKIKDSVLDNRTEIKTNLLKDVLVSSKISEPKVVPDSIASTEIKVEESSLVLDTEIANNPSELINTEIILEKSSSTSEVVEETFDTSEEISKVNTSDFHMVKKGETLYALSKRYNTTLGQLISANDLETTLIEAGETLRVRNFESLEDASEAVWIVSKGDTLYNIAKRNNTTVNDLKNLNGLATNLIKVGQKLQVNQNSTLSKK